MGVAKARKQTAFIVCAKADQRYGVKLFRQEGWVVRSGVTVSIHAGRALPAGSRSILVGHGEPAAFWLACGGYARSRKWLWAGMPRPPKDARIYLYSCSCASRLAPSLRSNFVVGHYKDVPTPRQENRAVVLPFLRKVFELMDTGTHATPAAFRPALNRLAARLVQEHYTDTDDRALIAAVLLAVSLYRAARA